MGPWSGLEIGRSAAADAGCRRAVDDRLPPSHPGADDRPRRRAARRSCRSSASSTPRTSGRSTFCRSSSSSAAVSLSNVLVQTKALDVITGALFDWMKPHITGTWVSTMVLYWSAFLYHIVIGNEIAMLSTSLPILMTYAREHGINPLAARHDLDVRRRSEGVHLRVGGPRGRLFVRLLQQQGHAQDRRNSIGGDGNHPAAARAALLAADRHRPLRR